MRASTDPARLESGPRRSKVSAALEKTLLAATDRVASSNLGFGTGPVGKKPRNRRSVCFGMTLVTGNPDIGTARSMERSQVGFVRTSISDRQVFAERSRRSRTTYRRRREKGRTSARHWYSSPFSAVRFDEQKSRTMGEIGEFGGNQGRIFSAVQTAWRRGRDSNPRYRC